MEYGGLTNSVEIPIPAEGQTVEVTTKTKKREPYPGFTIFGNGKTTRHGGTSMDILDICKELNLAEMNLMQFFRDYIEQNKARKEKNVNLLKPTSSDEWTSYLKVALKKNYPHMECLGIIKRVKRGTYMINPHLFIPPYDMDYHNMEWDSLDDNCKDKDESNN
jgi:hypothetical protein